MEGHVLNWENPIEHYFEEISRIPRESGNEGGVCAYLEKFAELHKLSCRRDDHKNVIIQKPASAGYEKIRPVMLQAHTDMVCEKRPSSGHDFLKDPISLYLKDGILRAKDTSLGADDGWGVAYMLAVLADDTLKHPALECVFTSEEETGCTGAMNLDMSQFKAGTIICLDGDRDVETFVSCFTSNRLLFGKEYRMEAAAPDLCWKKITLGKMSTNVYQGLVHQECGNSAKSLIRILRSAFVYGGRFLITELNGGIGEHCPPEQTEAVVGVLKEEEPGFEKQLRFAFRQLNEEYENTDFRGNLEITGHPGEQRALSVQETRNYLDFLYLLPNNMFQAGTVSGRPDCIMNIGVAKLKDGKASIVASDRSRFLSSAADLEDHCSLLAELMGFSMTRSSRYAGWEYNSSSEIKKLFNAVIKEEYGCGLSEIVCPGGLEIAYFVNGIPGIDAIEIGVNHDNPHSVEEAMEMHSFHKMYRVLTEVLKRMNTAS